MSFLRTFLKEVASKKVAVKADSAAAKVESKTGLIDPFAEDEEQTLKSVALSPDRIGLPIGKKQQLSAEGEYSDGTKKDVTKVVKWFSADPDIASVDAGSGLATGLKEGQAMIMADLPDGGRADMWVNIFVTQDATPILLNIDVAPAKATVIGGEQVQLTATGKFSDGKTADVTAKVLWMAANDGFASVDDKGLVTVKRPAEKLDVKIFATDRDGRATQGWADLTVEVAKDGKPVDAVDDSYIVDIFIDPEKPTLAVGAQQQFKVDALMSDERSRDVTKGASWSSSDPKVLKISADGMATALSAGDVELTATHPDSARPATIKFTVGGGDGKVAPTAPTAAPSIKVEPASATLAAGAKLQFTATTTDKDGKFKDVTESVDWMVNNLDILSIDATGLATAEKKAGTAEVTAMFAETGATSNAAKVTVTAAATAPAPDAPAAALERIRVEPGLPELVFGAKVQFTVEGHYADGSKRELTTGIRWGTGDAKIIKIDQTGLATAQNVAEPTTITAMDLASGFKDTAYVRVTGDAADAEPALEALGVEGFGDTMVVGQHMQLRATGMFADGTSREVTESVNWSSSDEDIVLVDFKGRAKAGSKSGKVKITATGKDGKVSRSLDLTVLDPLLKEISISPDDRTIVGGGQMEYGATGLFADGSMHFIDGRLTWSSSAPNVATIDEKGVATAQGEGTTTIRAKDPKTGVTKGVKLTVKAPGRGVRKVDVQILVKNYKSEPMLEGGFGVAQFDSPDAQEFQVQGEIRTGVLEFANLLLMPKGNLVLMLTDDKSAPTYLIPYELPKGDIMSFTAVQKPATAKVRAKTPEEAAKKAGASGKVGENLDVVSLGGEANGESDWQVTWGSKDFEVKQI